MKTERFTRVELDPEIERIRQHGRDLSGTASILQRIQYRWTADEQAQFDRLCEWSSKAFAIADRLTALGEARRARREEEEALIDEMRHIHEREAAQRDSIDPRTPDAARAWSLGAAFVTGYFLPKLEALFASASLTPSLPPEPDATPFDVQGVEIISAEPTE